MIQFASLYKQRKNNNKFKNKNQPELPENQIVWKSNNPRVKEETFVQTCMRDGDWQPVGEDSWQGGGWWTWRGSSWWSGWSHIHMRINQEEQLGSKTDLATQGSSLVK